MLRLQIRDGNGADQLFGVGMSGILEEHARGGSFHHHAQIHHNNFIRNMAYHGQIVGNEQIRQAPIPLQVHEKIQYLRLNGHIQGGYRLVTNNKLRFQGQRPGDADALSAPAVQLVGKHLCKALCQAHRIHQLLDLMVALRPRHMVNL
ncbi:hypothetical protein SDC9_177411 [bioreactor metagenome]|uniref:Uncharacterized protein n=1 Tax=bioreactor metagenome TaxID=1076179 RepID=A0A645H0W8_9ZZZZ